ncbi:MAG: nucleotidyltransferase domain-containing protein [Nitrospirota bacterium]
MVEVRKSVCKFKVSDVEMNQEKEWKVIKRLAQVIAQKYRPEKIILFGSYAYGKPNKESDIDLLIVKNTKKTFFKRLYEIRRIASEVRRGFPFEPVVLTPEEINERLKKGDQFFEDILSRGKVIYAKVKRISVST